MLQIYTLTPLGEATARSTRHPDSKEWAVLNHLRLVHHNSPDQIAQYCNLTRGEVASALMKLRARRLVVEETGVEV